MLVWLPQEDDQVSITRQLLHTLSAFSPDVMDLLPEKKQYYQVVGVRLESMYLSSLYLYQKVSLSLSSGETAVLLLFLFQLWDVNIILPKPDQRSFGLVYLKSFINALCLQLLKSLRL